MEIAYHLGVQQTDEDRILRCLRKNLKLLHRQGISVAAPARFRAPIRDIINQLNGNRADQDMQDLMIDTFAEVDDPQRIVLSHYNFFCVPNRVLSEGRIYPMAGEKVAALRNLFPEAKISFHLAIRNLATFAPELFELSGEADFQTFLSGVDITSLRWSEALMRMREAVPDCDMTVWCHEDAPILWPNILRAVGGYTGEAELVGADDFLATLMSSAGLSRLQSHIAEHPPASEEDRREIVAQALEKYGLSDELEVEIDLPGWSQDVIDTLTQSYDEDMNVISDLPGVTLLS